MTKRYEEVFRGTLSEAVVHFTAPRGEFVLVVRGADDADAGQGKEVDSETVFQELLTRRQAGGKARESVAEVAAFSGWPRRRVYEVWLTTAGESPGGSP